MKKIFLLSVLCLLSAGCKGPKGDPGSGGIQGVRGPGDLEMLSGSVTSNSFTVTDSRIGQASVITIYLTDGTSVIELPYYLPGAGVNAFSDARPLANAVDIFNAQTAGATGYIISLII